MSPGNEAAVFIFTIRDLFNHKYLTKDKFFNNYIFSLERFQLATKIGFPHLKKKYTWVGGTYCRFSPILSVVSTIIFRNS